MDAEYHAWNFARFSRWAKRDGADDEQQCPEFHGSTIRNSPDLGAGRFYVALTGQEAGDRLCKAAQVDRLQDETRETQSLERGFIAGIYGICDGEHRNA